MAGNSSVSFNVCVFLVERENKYVSDKKREKRNSTRFSVSLGGGEMPETKKGFSKTLIGKCGRARETNGKAE